MIAVSWCGCSSAHSQILIRGRLIAILSGGANKATAGHSACVRCGRVQLEDGSLAVLERAEHLALDKLARPVTYARDAINRGIPVHSDSLPSVEQLSELGLIRTIRSESLYQVGNATDAEVRAHMRGLFDIPAGTDSVRISVPGVRRSIIVGPDFVEHPFQKQRRRDDPDHMRFSSLAPQTVFQSLEIFFVRSAKGQSIKFLGAYRDLTEPPGRSPYIYHVAYALGDGRLTTSFRLTGGAHAFRQEREGRLLFASYAQPIVPILIAPS